MMKIKACWLATVFVVVLYSSAEAQLKPSPIFSDHMVLQQKRLVSIWGNAPAKTKINVKANWPKGKNKTESKEDGSWKTFIPTPPAGGPYEIEISTKDTVIYIKDVMVGEVWLCSGQSNMAWPLVKSSGADTIIQAANEAAIRMFTVERQLSPTVLDTLNGSWEVSSPNVAGSFSAVAYHYGKYLHKKLGIPIGLIHSSWGGTPVEAWIEDKYLKLSNFYKEKWPEVEASREKHNASVDSFQNVFSNWWLDTDAQLAFPEEFKQGEYNDADGWQSVQLPGYMSMQNMAGTRGVVWYQRNIEIPADWSGKDLLINLGNIDEYDACYFNGNKVGETWSRDALDQKSKYQISGNWVRPGKSIITVRVINPNGDGGILGPQLKISLKEASSEASTLDLSGEWYAKKGESLDQLPQIPRSNNLLSKSSEGVLFNGMINPLVPYNLKGVIWYQGESNTYNPTLYKSMFQVMIRNWREKWNQGDFPFYYVQIAPYKYGEGRDAALLREAQLQSMQVRNSGMAVSMDLGNPEDIHPRDKAPIGERLGRWAMAQQYGADDMVFSGPMYTFSKAEGNKIRIYLNHTDGGIVFKGGEAKHFEIAGSDKRFVSAKVAIEGDTIVVWSDEVAQPVAVRYAWSNDAMPNLFNGEGLPASPFRTDKWK